MKWLHTICNLVEPHAVVLMYHRIADVEIDPWMLAVSPKNFEAQIKHLTSKYHVIPVTELVKNIAQKKLVRNTACITFDDGYADNYLLAKPILEKYNCPATFFIPSYFIGQLEPFWWEELQLLFLETPQLPQLFQMPITDDGFSFDLQTEAHVTAKQLQKHKSWKWPQPALTLRCDLYLKVWATLKPLPLSEIETAIIEIKSWANTKPTYQNAVLPMTHEQLSEMAQNKLFDIGLHTTTHPALAYHNEEVQFWELAENKKRLQQYNPVNMVAFPYGNYNNTTLAVLRAQRVDAAFTTEAKNNTSASTLHCLGRFQVINEPVAAFENSLQNWLTS